LLKYKLAVKVSIVLPTYNRGYIIADAIRSALEQSYPSTQIIIVDDGSTDQTAEIVQSFARSGILYTRHERNRGYSAACNTGMAAAEGDLIAFLDSDDVWKPTYLQQQVDLLRRYPCLQAVFTGLEVHEWGGTGRIESMLSLMPHFQELLRAKNNSEGYIFISREMYLLEELPIKPS
jgi:glycosyltransferase involved in cell wall biosynthesis